MSAQLYACRRGTRGRVVTTQFTGTLIRRTATAVVSGTEVATAMITAFNHERNVKVDVFRHPALVTCARMIILNVAYAVVQAVMPLAKSMGEGKV